MQVANKHMKDTQHHLIIAAAAAKSLQSCLTLCDPINGSPPGSTVPGILQARTLEWVVISFSNAWKWKVKVKLLSRVWLFTTPGTAAYQALLSMEFSRQEYSLIVRDMQIKTKMRYHLIPVRAVIKKFINSKCRIGCGERRKPLYSVGGSAHWHSHYGEQNGDSFKKLEIKLPYDPAIPLLGMHPEEARTERNTCAPMFIAALFTITRTGK